MTNMRDRITAIGGTLVVAARPSHGARVNGSVPCPWPGAAGA